MKPLNGLIQLLFKARERINMKLFLEELLCDPKGIKALDGELKLRDFSII